MEKTANFNLNKPEPSDPLRLEDFNVNSDIIDAALGELSAARIYIGSFVGNGASSRTIQLPWKPKFALVLGHYNSSGALYVLVEGYCLYYYIDYWTDSTTGKSTLFLKDSTLVIDDDYRNVSGKTVYYILVR